MNKLPVTIKDIKAAHKVVSQEARKTPLVKSFYLSAVADGEIYLKLENMQLTGSFKFRGGYNKVSSLTKEQRDKGVIACSAGNHAQGVALASKLLGVNATIVMPQTAPLAKVNATKGYGAEVVLSGKTFDDAKKRCLEIMQETGQTFLDPFDDEQVIAGQGTIGIEILEDLWDVDTILCPIGGGGMISGIAVAVKSFNPNIKIVGVQAENVHGMKASFDHGEITRHFVDATLADGCAVQVPGKMTFEITKELVDDIVVVSEEEIELAMKDLMQRGKAVVEGSGALPTAAILAGKVDRYIKNKKVVAIVSGGNVDLARVSSVCDIFIAVDTVDAEEVE